MMIRWILLWGIVGLTVIASRTPLFAQAQRGATLPEAKVADLSEMVLIETGEPGDPAETWTYEPDVPRTPVRPPRREIGIELPHGTRSIAFSDIPAGLVAALQRARSIQQGRGTTAITQTWELHRFRLSTGQAFRPITLYDGTQVRPRRISGVDSDRFSIHPGALRSIGPDGNMAVVQTTGRGRLDVWSLKGRGRHLLGWHPYEHVKGNLNRPYWAAALDEEHVLTLNSGGHLIKWKIPECRALWERSLGSMGTASPGLSGIVMRPGMSVNHKHLAVWSGSNLLILDVQTGETLAVLGGINGGGFIDPTFHWDGTQLACTEAENHTPVLVVYDLRTGTERSRFPIPSEAFEAAGNGDVRYGGFTWLDERFIAIGDRLIVDLDTGRPIWRFSKPEPKPFDIPTVTHPGPLFWYLIQGNRQGLAGIHLPHDAARKAADNVPEAFAAGPGTTVSVAVNVNGSAEVQKALKEGLERRVQAMGMQVGEDQQVMLKLTSRIRNTGEQVLVANEGFGPPKEKEVIEVQAIVMQVSYVVNGKTAWTRSLDFLPSGSEVWKEDPTKGTQQELLDLQWERVKNHAENWLFTRIPGHVLDPKAVASIPSSAHPMPGVNRSRRGR